MTGDLFPEARIDPGLDLDRRYTTRETMALCRELAQVEAWDLDVAADEESHWAPRWYDVQQNGLEQKWAGRVWVNPPYSDVAAWVTKAWAEHERGATDVIAMLLPANRTEQPFWQDFVEPFRDRLPNAVLHTYHLPTRIKFGHPGNRDAVGVGSPPFGCVLLVWRRA